MQYDPKPIDNSRIELSAELKQLVERLAANNHDLWARRRIAEGWKYGPRRDDEAKQTPVLVPYDELPDSEKQYDRENAIETLKSIIGLGWTIQDPQHPGHAELTREDFQKRAKQANAEGEALLAADIASDGLKLWPGDAKLCQMQALALARMGSRERAHQILHQLQEAHDDEETLGLLARTYKDLWLTTANSRNLDQAYEAYAKAFRLAPDRYWTGINAATLAFLRGDGKAAHELAARIRNICNEILKQASGDDPYWLTATIAEACLLLELLPEAEQFYERTGQLGRERLGDVLSTWGNARLILSLMSPDIFGRIERALNVPKVVVFAGHRVDEPGSSQARLPEESTEDLKNSILKHLEKTRARFGYSSAASGSDILFLEAMQAIGGRTYVVLPCDQEQFIKESVASSGESWVQRFHDVISKAKEVTIASRERLNLGSIAYDFSNELMYGLANLRSKQFGTGLVHLAVWDGREGRGRGGTADIVKRWRQRTDDVIVLRPMEGAPVPQPVDASAVSASDDGIALPGFRSEIRAMLFADAYNFSHLSEAQMPVFIQQFMGPIAMLIRQTQPAPIFQNTWGDGLYMVFSSIREAGRFALKLAKRVAEIDRDALGLPKDITLRVALHAGPVYRYKDQIIDKLNYIGSHVNRAARIEPITPPGQIYVTDAFAALAELEVPGQFRFDYVGKTALAKKFGEFPMYNMQAGE
jgi:class 3 adenylate cyclase/tetratricopeptide (TPR) repeat protein